MIMYRDQNGRNHKCQPSGVSVFSTVKASREEAIATAVRNATKDESIRTGKIKITQLKSKYDNHIYKVDTQYGSYFVRALHSDKYEVKIHEETYSHFGNSFCRVKAKLSEMNENIVRTIFYLEQLDGTRVGPYFCIEW